MERGYQKELTLKNVTDSVKNNKYLLPALQRKFVWSSDKIEKLFDSIMQDYPINSFMFWEVTDSQIKNDFKFYSFLLNYRQRFNENNELVSTAATDPDFIAVIDGQQRLTSIYIGLRGSYATKLSKKWWTNDETNIPTKYLYLNLAAPKQSDDESFSMNYDFKFLQPSHIINDENNMWFKVGDILKFETNDELDDFIDENYYKHKFAKDALRKLRRKIFDEPLINYYVETKQDTDTVLDIFIRTNSGGEPLSFSDLLMSIIINTSDLDLRDKLPKLINNVRAIDQKNFSVSQDFILKTCLVISNADIKFQIKNFSRELISTIETNWDNVEKSILAAFKLLSIMGYNDSSLRAKNAVIPIIYYIYKKNIHEEINKPSKFHEEKKEIKKWLSVSLLKKVFSGQSDTVLRQIRTALNDNDNQFSFDKIKVMFANNPAKNLRVDRELLDELLTSQYGSPECTVMLNLLYSDLPSGYEYHQDHINPVSYFEKLTENDLSKFEDPEFYKDRNNYNSVLNLQLLNSELNTSKNDDAFSEWVEKPGIRDVFDFTSQLIPQNVNYDISAFKEFIAARKKMLIRKLEAILGQPIQYEQGE